MSSTGPETSATFYLLRAKGTSVGDGPYVGLGPDGAHASVIEPAQARRFATLEEAQAHAGAMSEQFGELEIEVRTHG